MPQFELEDPEAGSGIARTRARSAAEAARQWLALSEDADVVLEKPGASMDELEGWSVIRVAGEVRGRVRPHQRMRFRRD